MKLTDDSPRSFTTPWSVHAWSKRKGGSSRESEKVVKIELKICHCVHIPARLDVVLSILPLALLSLRTSFRRHPSVRINKRTTAK